MPCSKTDLQVTGVGVSTGVRSGRCWRTRLGRWLYNDGHQRGGPWFISESPCIVLSPPFEQQVGVDIVAACDYGSRVIAGEAFLNDLPLQGFTVLAAFYDGLSRPDWGCVLGMCPLELLVDTNTVAVC